MSNFFRGRPWQDFIQDFCLGAEADGRGGGVAGFEIENVVHSLGGGSLPFFIKGGGRLGV